MPKRGVPSDADESHRGVSEGKGLNVGDLEERPKKLGGCVTPLGAPRLPGMWLSFERHTYCRSRCILLCTGIRCPASTLLCPRRTRTSGRSCRSGHFSNEQKDRSRSNNLCMYCGRACHIINVCPQNGKAPARRVYENFPTGKIHLTLQHISNPDTPGSRRINPFRFFKSCHISKTIQNTKVAAKGTCELGDLRENGG